MTRKPIWVKYCDWCGLSEDEHGPECEEVDYEPTKPMTKEELAAFRAGLAAWGHGLASSLGQPTALWKRFNND